MPDALANIDARLERAEEHLKALQDEVDAVLSSLPYRIITDDDPRDLVDFQRILSEIRVPPRISILAGETIHQSRSALDHISKKARHILLDVDPNRTADGCAPRASRGG